MLVSFFELGWELDRVFGLVYGSLVLVALRSSLISGRFVFVFVSFLVSRSSILMRRGIGGCDGGDRGTVVRFMSWPNIKKPGRAPRAAKFDRVNIFYVFR